MPEALDKALDKSFENLETNLDRMSETIDRMLRASDQRLAAIKHDAWQVHLATETDVPTGKKLASVWRMLQQMK